MKSIIRVAKNRDNPYVMVDKRPLSNPDLSWKSKGLLVYLLSRPDDWKINMKDLENRSTDGREAVRSGMKELIDAGHVVRTRIFDEHKRITYVYTVYEQPVNGKAVDGKAVHGKPATTNKRITNNKFTNKRNTNISKSLSELNSDGELAKYKSWEN